MKSRLSPGMPVRCEDGPAGRLKRIIANPDTREPTFLVVEMGEDSARSVVVHVSLVADLGVEGLALNTTRDALRTYPEYSAEKWRHLAPGTK